MTITERAAIVLQEIDAALALAEKATPGPWITAPEHIEDREIWNKTGICFASAKEPSDRAFIATSRTGLPTALRCLKTAIEGLLKVRDATVQLRAHADPLLTTICDQWEAGR